MNDYSDTLLFPCFDNLTGEITSHSSTFPSTLPSTSPTRSLNPLDPEQPLQLSPEPSLHPLSPDPPLHSLSPEPPLNPLVFLPQYELSHLDLGGEVELEENFTEGRVRTKESTHGNFSYSAECLLDLTLLF